MRRQTIDITLLAVLAALWSALELTLGSLLHTLGAPFTGALLLGLALPILLVGRRAVPRIGSVSAMALSAAFLKVAILGGVGLGAATGILAEGVLFDLVLGRGTVRPARAALAGGTALAWTLIHPFFYLTLLGGWPLAKVYSWAVGMLESILSLPAYWGVVGLATALFAHFLVGCVAGAAAWWFCDALDQRSRFSHRLQLLRARVGSA